MNMTVMLGRDKKTVKSLALRICLMNPHSQYFLRKFTRLMSEVDSKYSQKVRTWILSSVGRKRNILRLTWCQQVNEHTHKCFECDTLDNAQKANDECKILISNTTDDNGLNLEFRNRMFFRSGCMNTSWNNLLNSHFFEYSLHRMLYEIHMNTSLVVRYSSVMWGKAWRGKKVGMIHSSEGNSIAPLISWGVSVCFHVLHIIVWFGSILILSVLICEYWMWYSGMKGDK